MSVTLSDGKEAGQGISTDEVYVTPGYFETLQIPVLAGRTFIDADGPDAQQVVVINQAFARKFLHSADPVGRYLTTWNKHKMLIVGVVATTVGSSAGGLTDDAAPLTSQQTIYRPAAQSMDSQSLAVAHVWFQPSWIVRTAGPVEGLPAQMQQALGQRRSQPALFRLLRDEGFDGRYSGDPEDGSRVAHRHGIARSVAECRWHLRLSGEHRGPEAARDRHPHGAGLHGRAGNVADRPVWRRRLADRRFSRAHPCSGSAASDASRPLRRRSLRSANRRHRRRDADPGHPAGRNPADPENRQNRSRQYPTRRITRLIRRLKRRWCLSPVSHV